MSYSKEDKNTTIHTWKDEGFSFTLKQKHYAKESGNPDYAHLTLEADRHHKMYLSPEAILSLREFLNNIEGL